ncbi:CDP-glucose 4,6-dehydratase [Polymorphobacter glacialis]|uniref:CDP-glucose 4,6-dehydratase n=1 Tax=Sandarakinorhabdus glacialis TaxID=1614636 RepID=A0A916ZU73_9SPHN|nr:CDP-glucose 4,6-dehydratase [Polymorphobacter glacialis]GGE14398.1 CDP-glucose 4,6-dehydratase [Polymorphobacter glacialis]
MRDQWQSGCDEARIREALVGRRVLLTGHTGFKGGWLALWLTRLGAHVVGVALPPEPGSSMFEAAGIADAIDSRFGDIRSPESFAAAVGDFDAEVVFHLAAQAIVRRSHADPVDTFLTNTVGTAVVLDAARRMPSLRAIVVVTSDKCYENREWAWGYRESDALGGADPYSASKACTEIVAACYRRSFFAGAEGPQLATVRGGNVIGGGDWSADRLLPDIVRAVLADTPVLIRNPGSVRPWQHVLDALSGYLTVAARLLEDGADVAEAWNFGPDPRGYVDVETIAGMTARAWGPGGPRFGFGSDGGPHEASLLGLDSAKAAARLGWRPTLDLGQAIAMTTDWYRHWADGRHDMGALSRAQIAAFIDAAALADRPRSHSRFEFAGDRQQCA